MNNYQLATLFCRRVRCSAVNYNQLATLLLSSGALLCSLFYTARMMPRLCIDYQPACECWAQALRHFPFVAITRALVRHGLFASLLRYAHHRVILPSYSLSSLCALILVR